MTGQASPMEPVARSRLSIGHAQDFWLGLFFLVSGVAFASVSLTYDIGSALSMGPGYFPFVLGALLALIGGLLGARALRFDRSPRETATRRQRTSPWPFLLVAGSLVLFALSVTRLGLFLAVAALFLLASLADASFSWRRSLVAAIVAAGACALLFVSLLGLPIAIWPQLGGST